MNTVEEFYDIIKKGQRYYFNPKYTETNSESMFITKSSSPALVPDNGVYVMFEKGELLNNGEERVVRIGINKVNGELPKRLMNHFVAKRGSSVFRKHIESCFNNSNLTPNQTKQRISEYIQTNISFVIFAIDDTTLRRETEKKLIALIAQSNNKPSENWLGKKCQSNKIKNGNLWNVVHISGTPITSSELKNIANTLIR